MITMAKNELDQPGSGLQGGARVLGVVLCGAMIALLGVSRARADEWDKKTVITVNQPIQIRDRVLDPGTYVLRLLNSAQERYTVQIFNGDQTRIIDTVFAVPTYRIRPADQSEFTFWETPPGTARALRDWYYPGDNYGREFPYPKHPAVLTALLNAPPPAPMAPEPVAAPAPPAPEPESEAAGPAPGQPAQASEVAVAPEPQPAPEPEPQPAPAPEPTPAAQEAAHAAASLPKTASPYPPIGLAGLLAVGVYSLLRRRRAM